MHIKYITKITKQKKGEKQMKIALTVIVAVVVILAFVLMYGVIAGADKLKSAEEKDDEAREQFESVKKYAHEHESTVAK